MDALIQQQNAGKLMLAGVALMAVGIGLESFGAVMTNVGTWMATAAAGAGTTAVLRNGYYYVNGFKFSQYYYEKLWTNGRGAPSLIARCILEATGGQGVPDPYKAGFFQYIFDGWKLVYNPATGEVWHLCQL